MSDAVTCGYRKSSDKGKQTCSEKAIYQVTGTGKWGRHRTTPVCAKHWPDAVRDWDWDSVEPV